jgi:hypothetical protein
MADIHCTCYIDRCHIWRLVRVDAFDTESLAENDAGCMNRRWMEMELLKTASLLDKSSYQELHTQTAVVVNLTLKFDNPGIQISYKQTTRLL